MQRHPRHARSATALLLALGLGLGVGACGSDEPETAQDEDPTETSAPDDSPSTTAADDGEPAPPPPEGFCEAVLAIAASDGPEVDPEASPEDQAAAGQSFTDDVIVPAVEVLRGTAPEEVAADVETLTAAVEATTAPPEEGSDPAAAPDAQAASAALSNIVAATTEPCGWPSVDVTATEYAFAGVPETVPAGITVFQLQNDGEELHELLLLRKNDGVTEPFEELAVSEEAQEKLSFVTAVSFTDPGASKSALADLEPGEYGFVCTIPVGTTSIDAPAEPEQEPGAPHLTEGQIATFTVG